MENPLSPDQVITVLLADDHPTTLAGIRAILRDTSDIKVIGEAENGNEVMELVPKLCPKILLLDLLMPGPSPAELEKWVRTNHPDTVTLVLTAQDRDAYLANMMDAGVAGFIVKTESSEQLITAIRPCRTGGNSIRKRTTGSRPTLA